MSHANHSPRAPDFSWRREMARLADDWPLAQTAARTLAERREWALLELKQRLDAVEQDTEAESSATPGEDLAARLRAGCDTDRPAARDALYRRTLGQLLPDEALMFAHLMRTNQAPLGHVIVARWPWGRSRWTVLANASTLARDAGVLLPERVCEYVATLRDLGLCRVEPAAGRCSKGFELLLAETNVREALETAGRRRKSYPRLVRWLLCPSAYGQAIWADCGPTDP